MIIDYQVIDNFLPQDLFTQIKEFIIDNGDFPWYHNKYITTVGKTSNTEFSYFCCWFFCHRAFWFFTIAVFSSRQAECG